MDIITVSIEEIANLVSHRFYLSIHHDGRKKNDALARMITEIKQQESALLHENEEALRIELADEIIRVRRLRPPERVALYSEGSRWLVAMLVADLAQ